MINRHRHSLARSGARWVAAMSMAWISTLVAAQTASPETSEGVKAALAGWIESFNRGAPTAAYFAGDAVLVRGNGTFTGAATINDMEQRESKAGLRLTLVVDQVQFVGPDVAIVTGRYTVAPPGSAAQVIPGVALHTMQRTGSTWQVRGASFTRTQAPPAPAGAASS